MSQCAFRYLSNKTDEEGFSTSESSDRYCLGNI